MYAAATLLMTSLAAALKHIQSVALAVMHTFIRNIIQFPKYLETHFTIIKRNMAKALRSIINIAPRVVLFGRESVRRRERTYGRTRSLHRERNTPPRISSR